MPNNYPMAKMNRASWRLSSIAPRQKKQRNKEKWGEESRWQDREKNRFLFLNYANR